MARWAVGFFFVATLYLAVGLWLIRRWRRGRQRAAGGPPAEAETSSASDSPSPDDGSAADG